MRSIISSLLCASLCAACATELDVRKLDADQPRVGVGYVLPFTQYKVKLTWRVVQCIPGADKAAGQMKIATKVEIEDGQADDAEHAYLINPNDLQSLLSISSFQMKWEGGRNMFTSVNASAEDRSAQTIGKTVLGLGKLALAGAGGAFGPDGKGPDACNAETATAVTVVATSETTLQTRARELKAAQLNLKTITDKVAAMGANASEDAKKELGEAIATATTATTNHANAIKALTEALEAISYTRTEFWPLSSKTFETDKPFNLPQPVLVRWGSIAYADNIPAVLADTGVYLNLKPANEFARIGVKAPATLALNATATAGDKIVNGIRYRMPAQGRVFACSKKPCDNQSPDLLATLDGPVAQLGYVNILPVKTRPFGNTTFAAEMTPLGGLKSAGYEQKSAPGEGMASAFSDFATAASPLLAFDAASEARARAEELAELDFLKKKKDALAALADNPNSAAAASTVALQADTALVNAQIANLNAQIALADTQARMSALAK